MCRFIKVVIDPLFFEQTFFYKGLLFIFLRVYLVNFYFQVDPTWTNPFEKRNTFVLYLLIRIFNGKIFLVQQLLENILESQII